MTVQLANNASALLAADITDKTLTLTVGAGQGELFPNPGTGEWFPITLEKRHSYLEIVRCIARDGDVLTIERGQEGTSPNHFHVGDTVELRLSVGTLADRVRDIPQVGSAQLELTASPLRINWGRLDGGIYKSGTAIHEYIPGGALNNAPGYTPLIKEPVSGSDPVDMSVSPDGSTIAVISASETNKLSIITVENWTVEHPVESFIPDFQAASVAYSNDGQYLAVGLNVDPRLIIFRTSDWSTVTLGTTITPSVRTIAWSPADQYVALGVSSVDGGILVINTSNWTVIAGTDSLSITPNTIKFSPSENRLVGVGASSPFLQVLNTSTWTLVAGTPTLPGIGHDCDYNHNGGFLAVGHNSGDKYTIYNTADWSTVTGLPAVNGFRVVSVAYNSDGTRLALGPSISPLLVVLDTSDWSVVPGVPEDSGDPFSIMEKIKFYDSGSKLAIIYEESPPFFKAFDVNTWQRISQIDGLETGPGGLGGAISPNGQWFAVGTYYPPYLRVFNVSDFSEISVDTTNIDFPDYNSIAFSPNSQYLAVASMGPDKLVVFDTSDWSLVPGITAFDAGNGRSLAFSNDGTWLAVGGVSSPGIRVYSTADWTHVGGTPVVSGVIFDIEFSGDDTLLGIGFSSSPFLYVLDTSDWSVVDTPALPDRGRGVSFNPVSGYLAVAHDDPPYLTVFNSTTWKNIVSPWAKIGDGLAITSVSSPSLAGLSATRLAFIDATNDELRAYDFSGTTWSQTGNGLTLTGDSADLAGLSASRIAIVRGSTDDLRTFDFDGTNWAQVGNTLAITGVGVPTITVLSSTRIALFDTGNDELRTYDFDGTDWAQVGNGLSISVTGTAVLAGLSSSRVAYYDNTNDGLRAYDFDGTDWSQVGNSLAITAVGTPALTALSATRVIFTESAADDLRAFDFDGIDWAQVDIDFDLSGAGVASLTALSLTEFAFIDDTNDELRTYEFDLSTVEDVPTFTTTNWSCKFSDNGDFLVVGTGSDSLWLAVYYTADWTRLEHGIYDNFIDSVSHISFTSDESLWLMTNFRVPYVQIFKTESAIQLQDLSADSPNPDFEWRMRVE